MRCPSKLNVKASHFPPAFNVILFERLCFVPDPDLVSKRTPVGVIAIICLAASGALLFWPEHEGVQAAFLRVGLLMAAFWLAMPTKSRPAAWKSLQSPWTLPVIVVFAVFLPRLKYMLPVIAIFAIIAWFARPRRKR